MSILVVIPAFNEEKVIEEVIKNLKFNGYKNILVIDDGSTDKTNQVARKLDVTVVRHVVNRGLGAALGTGFSFAKNSDVDVLVTFDSDGQHKASDINKLISRINDGYDVVIGSRLADSKKMPLDRLIINRLANIFTFIVYGIYCSDSQSGLRAFSKKAIEKINLRTDRMEVSSEILMEVKKNNFKLSEVPIEAIYTDYSRKKGQGNLNAVNIIVKMFLRLFR